MSGPGGADPAAFVEAEAEESGAEGGGGDSEEDLDAEDDGADLEGFIAEGGDGAAADAAGAGDDGGESSESDEAVAGDDDGLGEDDLAVLQDAGLDTSQVKRRQDPEGGAAPAKRQRTANEELEQDLFGDDDEFEDLDAAEGRQKAAGDRRQQAGGDVDFFEGMSDEGSVDDFIVEDSAAAAKRRREALGAAEMNITDEQLQEITEIFGDTSVLRPLDQQEEELEPPKQEPPTVDVSEGEEKVRDAPAASHLMEEVDPEVDVDPDLVAKVYGTAADRKLQMLDVPERWHKAYHAEPLLLGPDGRRVWTAEEHDCEAGWIWTQKFNESRQSRDHLVRVIAKVLVHLHDDMLDPVYVVDQLHWKYSEVLTTEDLWMIAECDLRWQGIWALYVRLQSWARAASESQALPRFIIEAISTRTFMESRFPECELKDVRAWFCISCPDACGGAGAASSAQEARKLQVVRDCKLDEKLGVRATIEDPMGMTKFGITPQEFGENVADGRQRHPVPEDQEDRASQHAQVCSRNIGGPLKTKEQVSEHAEWYLSRLIASDPRVRGYVRKQFWDRVAVSTHVTEAGKPIAQVAATTFRRAYRAYHLVNKPAKAFLARPNDELFLDVLNLQRQGFVRVDYVLLADPDTTENTDLEHRYRISVHGKVDQDIVKEKQWLGEHYRRVREEGDYVPTTAGQRADGQPDDGKEQKEALSRWTWCKEFLPKIEAAHRCIQAQHRIIANKNESANGVGNVATELFKVVAIEMTEAEMSKLIAADPICDHLQKLYCHVEAQAQEDVYVVPGGWNTVRQRIIQKALLEVLYPLLWAEVQEVLARNAEEAVCAEARHRLVRMVEMQPRRLTQDRLEEDRRQTKLDCGDQDFDVQAFDELLEDPKWHLEKEIRTVGFNSVLVVCIHVINDIIDSFSRKEETATLALVNSWGDPVDVRQVFAEFWSPELPPEKLGFLRGHKRLQEERRVEHQEVFKRLLREHKPSFILLPVLTRDISRIFRGIRQIIDSKEMAKEFPIKPEIIYGDPSIPRAVAYHPRLQTEGVYRDVADPLQRVAISAARFAQDPLAEAAQLYHEIPSENGLLKVRLHRLQAAVPEYKLARQLMIPLIEGLSRVGADVNRIRRSPHLQGVCQFLPGLGPRKAVIFRKCMADVVTSRAELAERLQKHLRLADAARSPVVTNLLPFVKICPDLRDNWDIQVTPGFDRTRLGEPYRQWMESFCREGLKALRSDSPQEFMDDSDDEEDGPGGDCVKKLINHVKGDHSVVERLENRLDICENWITWAGYSDADMRRPDGELAYASIEDLLVRVMPEISQPFRDNRKDFDKVNELEAFYLAIGENEDNFSKGTLVNCVVQRDDEYDDKKPDKPADGKTLKVHVEVNPSEVRGSFPKMYREGDDKAGYIAGCERKFDVKGHVRARVVMMLVGDGDGMRPWSVSLSVNKTDKTWEQEFPVKEDDALYFMPHPNEDWTRIELGWVDMETKAQHIQKREWVQRKRNIRHPNWVDSDQLQALAVLDRAPQGHVLFRASKRHELIIAMLKVHPTDGMRCVDKEFCYRNFEILEKGTKEDMAFELSKTLEVDGQHYKDLDEVIARHMDPVLENLRLMQEHHRFNMGFDDAIIDKETCKKGLREMSRAKQEVLFYCLLDHDTLQGHGALLWTYGNMKVKEEFIEITNIGYSLWNQHFATISKLIDWFKEAGYRASKQLRSEFKQSWAQRMEAAKARRGVDVTEGQKKRFEGFNSTATTTSGLQTPGGPGNPMTAGGFTGLETAAQTPQGARAPGSAGGAAGTPRFGGYVTPNAMVPGTPNAKFVVNPGTARSRAPSSPAPSMVPATPGGAVPGTPGAGPGAQPWGAPPAQAPRQSWGGPPAQPAPRQSSRGGQGGGDGQWGTGAWQGWQKEERQSGGSGGGSWQRGGSSGSWRQGEADSWGKSQSWKQEAKDPPSSGPYSRSGGASQGGAWGDGSWGGKKEEQKVAPPTPSSLQRSAQPGSPAQPGAAAGGAAASGSASSVPPTPGGGAAPGSASMGPRTPNVFRGANAPPSPGPATLGPAAHTPKGMQPQSPKPEVVKEAPKTPLGQGGSGAPKTPGSLTREPGPKTPAGAAATPTGEAAGTPAHGAPATPVHGAPTTPAGLGGAAAAKAGATPATPTEVKVAAKAGATPATPKAKATPATPTEMKAAAKAGATPATPTEMKAAAKAGATPATPTELKAAAAGATPATPPQPKAAGASAGVPSTPPGMTSEAKAAGAKPGVPSTPPGMTSGAKAAGAKPSVPSTPPGMKSEAATTPGTPPPAVGTPAGVPATPQGATPGTPLPAVEAKSDSADVMFRKDEGSA